MFTVARALLLCAFATTTVACLPSGPSTCADGALCPLGRTCASGGGCAPDEQVAACDGEGKVDGDPCVVLGGGDEVCQGGVCLPTGCGNGVISASEDCEGDDLDGASCLDVGYYGGTLACGADCRYDTSACTGRCGDGVVDGAAGEACDGAVAETCAAYGFDFGRPTCSDACALSFEACGAVGFQPGISADSPLSASWVADNGDVFAIGADVLFVRRGNEPAEFETPDMVHYAGTWTKIDGCDESVVWAARHVFGQVGETIEFGLYDGDAWSRAAGDFERVAAIACTGAGLVYAFAPTQAGAEATPGSIRRRADLSGSYEELPAVGLEVAALDAHGDALYAGTSNGIWALDGVAWAPVGLAGVDVRSVLASGDELWAGDATGQVHHFDGAAWSSLAYGDAAIVQIVRVGDAVVVRDEAGAVRRHDGIGATVVSQNGALASIAGSPTMLHAVAGGQVGTVAYEWERLAYAAGGDVLVASDGALWTAGDGLRRDGEALPLSEYDGIVGLWQGEDDVVWAIGMLDRYRYQAGALTSRGPAAWAFFEDVRGVTGATYDDFFKVVVPVSEPPSEFGTLYHVTGDDQAAVRGGIKALWGPGDGTAFAVGQLGLVTYFDGAAWTDLDAGTTETLNAVGGTSATDVHVVGASGAHRHWDGTAWSSYPGSVGSALGGVADGGDGVFVSTGSGRVYQGDQLGWAPLRGIAGVTDLAFDGDELVVGSSAGAFALRAIR